MQFYHKQRCGIGFCDAASMEIVYNFETRHCEYLMDAGQREINNKP